MEDVLSRLVRCVRLYTCVSLFARMNVSNQSIDNHEDALYILYIKYVSQHFTAVDGGAHAEIKR